MCKSLVVLGAGIVLACATAAARADDERPAWQLPRFDSLRDLAIFGPMFDRASAEQPSDRKLWREVWAGADVERHAWLVYSGVTVAPFGGIHDNGLRLRLVGGYGGYKFEDRRAGGGIAPQPFKATTHFADALVGYLHRFGPLTAKAFAGVSLIDHGVGPGQPLDAVYDQQVGAKAVVELWLNLGERGYASLDLAYTTAHETASLRTRVGYRILPTLSLGVEAGLNRNAEDEAARAGLFARYEWYGGEISLAGGVASGGPLGFSTRLTDELSPYATVNWLVQF